MAVTAQTIAQKIVARAAGRDAVEVGDYVIVHVGYALSRLDPEEAAHTLALFAELAAHHAGQAGGATHDADTSSPLHPQNLQDTQEDSA